MTEQTSPTPLNEPLAAHESAGKNLSSEFSPNSITPFQPSHEGDKYSAEEAVAVWANGVRPLFGRERKNYNFAVCDSLAAAGVIPNANAVLKVGKWGSPPSIAADVAEWFQTLAGRLRAIEANIPLPARRKANDLIEQLFGFAGEQAIEKLRPVVRDYEDKEQAFVARLQAYEAESDQLRLHLSSLETDLVASQTLLAGLNQQLEASHATEIRLHDTIGSLTRDLALGQDAAKGAEQLYFNLQLSMAQAAIVHAKALLDATNAFEAERRRMMLASDAEKVTAAKLLEAEKLEIRELRKKIEDLSNERNACKLATAGAQAALQSVTQQKDAESTRFAEKESHYASSDYRLNALLVFVYKSRKIGVGLVFEDKTISSKDAITWIEEEFQASNQQAVQILSNVINAEPKTISTATVLKDS